MIKIYINIIFFGVNLLAYVSDKYFAKELAASNDAIHEDVLANTALQEFVSSNDSLQNHTMCTDAALKQSSSNITPQKNTSNENCEKGNSQMCSDPEETNNVTEIMDEAVYRLRQYANFNHGYNDYYIGDEELSLCFTEHEGTEIERFYLAIPNPDKYNEIVKMFYTFKGISYLGNLDVKARIVRKYYSNLVMMYNDYKGRTIPFHGYSYVLSADVQESEDITMFVQTSVDINGHKDANKTKYKNTIVESANSFNTDVYTSEYTQMQKIKKLFINLSGLIIKKKSDYVGITYVNSIYDDKSLPKSFRDRDLRAKNMLHFINLIKTSFKE
ncbi:erythrocyte membrane associated protein 1, putative [Plasmodium chabaudi chabaudi]|uniref:Erythrocyte membrane associated protein 1, putative n=1 Tax=Plasmodium chabaudi chabaudi TaxID=31271 RepID=A0A1C6WRR7_PLACU|nr:erythrocyte membrane associated protein 1, putative [Plasmodium chabaudi chabaudi]SCL91598.1 erythrocyte membrane associated protein 1, putative [Plasmodium chabaudi chabaudi]